MAGAENRVVAGDYIGKYILAPGLLIKHPTISVGWQNVELNKSTVESYEVVTDEHRKSAASGVARGLIGGALLGPVGLLAGALSAKNRSIYNVAIHFKDGKKSLVEVNETIYKAIVKSCF